jgi:hypothetical protein
VGALTRTRSSRKTRHAIPVDDDLRRAAAFPSPLEPADAIAALADRARREKCACKRL